MPVWSPMMKPLPATAFRMDSASASICSAEKFLRTVSKSISKDSATYWSMSPTLSAVRLSDDSIASRIAFGTSVPTDDPLDFGV